VSIGLDGLEAIRLADIEGLYQDAAAQRMGVSRQTYARVLSRARQAVAVFLVERRMLFVRPGQVIEEAPATFECPVHGGPRRQGKTCHCPVERSCRCGTDCRRGPRPAVGAAEQKS